MGRLVAHCPAAGAFPRVCRRDYAGPVPHACQPSPVASMDDSCKCAGCGQRWPAVPAATALESAGGGSGIAARFVGAGGLVTLGGVRPGPVMGQLASADLAGQPGAPVTRWPGLVNRRPGLPGGTCTGHLAPVRTLCERAGKPFATGQFANPAA